MNQARLLIDANSLVLLLVGWVSPSLISKHKRLQAFTAIDFDLLKQFCANYQTLVVTPNTLTEASNLALQITEPARNEIKLAIAKFVKTALEIYSPSLTASMRPEYNFLGIADCAQLGTDIDLPLLTEDNGLYRAALGIQKPAFNFTHIRVQNGTLS